MAASFLTACLTPLLDLLLLVKRVSLGPHIPVDFHGPGLRVLRKGGLPSQLMGSDSCPLSSLLQVLESWGTDVHHTEEDVIFPLCQLLSSVIFLFPFSGCSLGKFFGP